MQYERLNSVANTIHFAIGIEHCTEQCSNQVDVPDRGLSVENLGILRCYTRRIMDNGQPAQSNGTHSFGPFRLGPLERRLERDGVSVSERCGDSALSRPRLSEDIGNQ